MRIVTLRLDGYRGHRCHWCRRRGARGGACVCDSRARDPDFTKSPGLTASLAIADYVVSLASSPDAVT